MNQLQKDYQLILIHCIDVDKNARRKQKKNNKIRIFPFVRGKNVKKNNNHNKLLNKPN